jgi:hypothetical protein
VPAYLGCAFDKADEAPPVDPPGIYQSEWQHARLQIDKILQPSFSAVSGEAVTSSVLKLGCTI